MINLDHTFAALAHPKRRAIVARLVRGDATVSELAEPFGVTLLALSRHLKVLEDAALISIEPQGKHRRCRLRREALTSAAEWIDFHRTFWNSNFNQTDARLKRTKRKKKKRERGERPDPPSLMG
jgi:DNA-binding transcriptional ArsR family regulator